MLPPIRPFQTPDATELSLCLVPWADLLNHSSEASILSCLSFDPDASAAVLAAHRTYAPGSEVFDSYGPWLTPRQLFLDHGFVDEENGNHVAEVQVSHVAREEW